MAADPQEITVPMTFGEVDAAWLTAVLAQQFPGVVVRRAAVVTEILGACAKLRVAVDYNDAGQAAGLPSTLIVKGNFGRQGPELDFMFETEMLSYRDVVARSDLHAPRCYYAGGSGGKTMLVLEDLAGPETRFGSIEAALRFEDAVSILDQLARLHARFWNRSLTGLEWIGPTLSADHFAFLNRILEPAAWAHYLTLPRGVSAPRSTAGDATKIAAALRSQQEFHRSAPQTLCHGDAHGANIYFDRAGGGLFDWFLRRGPWFHDVAYFITGTLDIADRRRWEMALLNHYLEQLAAHGVTPPSLDEAFYCYRRELIFGYVLMIGNGEPGQYWKETATTAAAIRFFIAAEDHRMLDAFGLG